MSLYRIQRFAKLTGLSTHLIRAWERRYGLVNPIRGENRYRLYTDDDVKLFRFLKSQMDQGIAIGELAGQGREKLQEQARHVNVEHSFIPQPSDRLVLELTQAIQENERSTFEKKLNGALAVIPFEEALHRFLLPLMARVGQLWHDEQLGVAQEHYVSNQVKQKIFSALNQFHTAEDGPLVIVGCPANEWHEIAALSAAYLCRTRGCRVHYAGANLPIYELSSYCIQIQPSCVLLSVTGIRSFEEARQLALALASNVVPVTVVGVGGQGITPHADVFARENIVVFRDLRALDQFVYSLKH